MIDPASRTPFWLGCAVWAYRGWAGNFFPESSKPSDYMALYLERMSAVEGNTTFYAVPDEATVTRWAEQMPPNFKLCAKLHRELTHDGPLSGRLPRVEAFRQRLLPLGEHLGPMMLQLPPSYSPALWDDLARFLAWWPADTQLAVEVRHSAWWAEPWRTRLFELLSHHQVGRVLLDTRPIYSAPGGIDTNPDSERKKPRVPLEPEITAPFTIVRCIGHPDPDVTAPWLEGWADQVTQWLSQAEPPEVYFFAHCPIEERSPGYARIMQRALEARGVPVPPLPWDNLPVPPRQLSLL